MNFIATFHKSQTDKDGESKIIFSVPNSEIETIMKITEKYAGAQVTFIVSVDPDPSCE